MVSSLASCPVRAGPWPSPGSLTCGSLFRRREHHLARSQLTVFRGVLLATPPPAGFPPFSWPTAEECVVIERFGSSLDGGSFPDVLVSSQDVEPPSSPIAQEPDSASVDSPDDVVLLSPLVDVSTDSVPDVIRPVAPSPPMEQPFAPDRLWAPVAVPSPAIDTTHGAALPARSTVGAGCCSVASHRQSP